MARGTYILRKNHSVLSDLADGQNVFGMGVGNVYWVIKSTESYYADFLELHKGKYIDGSVKVYTDIQSALDVTVANRNDYVIVQPSQDDYDLTAALTLSKKAVHLICTAGLGNDVGATNAARLDQTTSATPVMTVSAASVEIAGFYIKNFTKITALELAQNAYAPNIHHNNFIMRLGSTDSEPIIDTVVSGNSLNDGGSWGSLERNWFVDASPATTMANIINYHSNVTAGRIKYNEITIGDGMVATIGIKNNSVKGVTDFNTFHTGGGGSGGTFTHCISIHASGSAIGNRGTVADSVLVTGGTNDASFSDNMNGVDGGVIDDAD